MSLEQSPSESTDQIELSTLISAGDPKFVDLLYQRYGPALYTIALRIVQDEEMAKDVVQDAFIKIWKNHMKYDPDRSRVFTWAYQIVRNTALDKLRASKKYMRSEIQTATDDVSSLTQPAINSDAIDLPAHIGRLEKKYRVVLNELYYKGLTQQEASERLGLPLGTIKTRLRIALRELRRIYIEKKEMKD